MARSIRQPVRRRRRHTISFESEIRAKARQIMNDQMADAMKAAALMIVGRKLDEIRGILQGAGFADSVGARLGSVQPLAGAGGLYQQPPPPAVEHPCVQCGREGMRKTRPNKFNTKGSWYCAAHAKLAVNSDYEDSMDAALLGNQAGPPVAKPPAVPASPPIQMIPQAQPMVQVIEAPQEGSASLEDAFSALGVH